MWHEARRQGRKVRGTLVDYRKRAERRRDYYEGMKADPTQFLQIHGRQSKIHLDQNIAATAENAVMTLWKDQPDIIIDRFDVRAHLESIPRENNNEEEEMLTQEDRQINYERYRILAQNSFLKISEDKFLKQLNLEEHQGYGDAKGKKDSRAGVSIGFNYEETSVINQKISEDSEDDQSDIDLDVDLIINVTKLDTTQANEMNKHGCNFGMSSNDFYSFLINDLEEAEALKIVREEEQEKALFSGRKSRRARRSHRERKLSNKTISPPSYAAKSSPSKNLQVTRSKSRSRSTSPDVTEKITYITSFGEDEEPSTSKSKTESRSSHKYNKPSNSKNCFKGGRFKCSRCRRNSRVRYRRSRSITTSSSKSSSRSSSRTRKDYKKRQNCSSSSSSNSSSSSSSSINSKSISANVLEKDAKLLPRYYGRKKYNSSSDSSDLIINTESVKIRRNTTTKKSSTNSIIERLKRKRQVLINKQFKADKIAEQLKTDREKLEQRAREDELREMSIKLRKRRREIRHANDSYTSNDSDLSSSGSSRGRKRDCKRNFRSCIERSISRDNRRNRQRENKSSRRSSKDLESGSEVTKLVNY